VHESSLGLHQVELVVDSGEHLCDSGGVGDHADCAHDLGQVSSGDDSGGLLVDSALESGGAPVHELDGSLGLDGGDGSVDVLRDDVSSVHQAACHVLSVSRVALGHHGGGLEARVGDLCDGELLVVSLLCGDDGGLRRQHEVDSGLRHQVGLELGDVDVQGAVESQGCGQGGDDLSDQSVQVGLGGSLDVQVASADVLDSLVVEHDSDVGVLQQGVGGQHGVVGLNHSGGDLRGRLHGESELGLLSVVDGESLQEQRSESGSGSSSNGVEDQESLETGALVSELSDSVEDQVHDFLSDGVVSSCEVVGSVFLAGDQLLRVVQLSVSTGSDLVDDGRLKVDEDRAGDVLASSSLAEEGVESVVAASDGLVGRHLSVWLDTVLEAEEFPAGVSYLDSSLSYVNANDFSHLNMKLIL